ncbi:MAG TPA: DUF3427 domain-containing protein [Pseudonocardiaceae bacterium]|nr:DUF3427 domain-containing protein [Pseudonocardiaceae bacterium]
MQRCGRDQRLSAGTYESLRTRGLDRALGAVPNASPQFGEIEPAEAPEVLARHIADAVRRALQEQPHHQRLKKINNLLARVSDDADVVVALEQLLALAIPEAPGVHQLVRPATPLSDVALLTNAPGEPSLGGELRLELASADQVDLLCAFIRWHGIRVLADELDALRARGVPLRVITTTYRGATERRALDELVRRFGAEVRIRYDAQSTRLHAKAWLFRRNSGFDTGYVLPDVDTLLLLRPTSSATVFLQQLGRGLRRTPGKAVLTVLDFIGQHRREYRFDLRYRALTGTSRSRLRHEIEQGFPFLPSGSQLILDRVARDIVLDNVRGALSRSRRELVADLRSHGDMPLAEFLSESGRELADVYGRPGQSWTGLRRAAGLPTLPAGPHEDALLRRVVALSHVDDSERSALYNRLATTEESYSSLLPHAQAVARMLFFTLWPDRGDFASYDDGLARLRAHPAVAAEIKELLALTTDRARHVPRPLDIPDVTLLSHASYRREEILAGIGWANWQRKPHGRAAGVAWAPETVVDALLVTLRKEERDFSPTTRYRDYPLAADLFHWESQNSTSRDSATGRRYLTGGSRVLLFVRTTRNDELGSAPYLCLGQATLVEHRGERPIAITWRLHRPMPPEVLHQGSVASG